MGTIRDPKLPRSFLRFLHKGLGLKNLADHIEQRQSWLGLAYLDIRTVVDVGANRGLAARDSLRVFPNAHVYCIEPIPALCDDIERWFRRRPGSVTVKNVALRTEPGTSTLYIDKRNHIWSTFIEPRPDKASQYDPLTVQVTTLDTLAKQMNLVDEVLVKIDTEGSDLEVIQGGTETLRRATAVMVESVFYPNALGPNAPTFEDIFGALHDLGYVYRGSLRVGCHRGTPMLADVLFLRRPAAELLATRLTTHD